MGEIRSKGMIQIIIVCVIGLISVYCTERKLISNSVNNNRSESTITTASLTPSQPLTTVTDEPKDIADKEKIIIPSPISSIAQDNKQAPLLTIDKVIDKELKSDEYYLYEIEAGADQYLQATVIQQGIDVVVSVFDPAGKKVYEVDSPNGTAGPEPVYLITENAGKYKLEVRSLEKSAPAGKYQLMLEQLRGANPTDKPRVAAYKVLNEAVILGVQRDQKSVEAAINKYQAAINLFEETKDELQLAFACDSLAELYRLVANYGKAEPLYQRALAIREKVLGAEHTDVADSLYSLGLFYYVKSDYGKTEPLYQRALAIREKILGAEHTDVALSLNSLGLLYYAKGDYTKAESFHQKALTIYEKAFGAEDPLVAQVLNNLGTVYYDKNDYSKAESYYQRALKIYEKTLKADNALIAITLTNLADLYREKGSFNKAEPLYQRAISIYERTLGAQHPKTAQPLNNLAILYQEKGDYSKAEILYQRAISIREKAFGAEHTEVAQSISNLAALYQEKGEYNKAEPLCQRVLTIYEKVLGAEHIKVARSFNNLAELYRETGEYSKAEPLYQKALVIYEKALGAEHTEVAKALNNLALLYKIKGDYNKAEPIFQRALTIREKALGVDHVDVAQSFNNLAELYREKGDYNKAESLYKKALTIKEKVLGANHPLVAQSFNNLAELYREKGEYNKAEPLFQKALAIFENALGKDHSLTATTLNNLALLYQTKGDYGKAELLFQRALTIYEDVLRKEHPLIALALNNLARLYEAKKDFNKAESFYQRALTVYENVLGKEHQDVASTLNNMAGLYQQKREIKQAISYKIRANECNENDLLRNLISGSENEKLLYLKRIAFDIDYTLTLHLQSAHDNLDILQAAMTIVLQRKGRALDVMTQSIETLRKNATPEDQQLFNKLAQARAQLSALILRGPGKEGLDNHKIQLKTLSDEVEALEKQISTRSAEFKVQINPITLTAVQQAIPNDAALLEFAVYRPYDAKTNTYKPVHYAVYILKHNGELKWVELGEASIIDNAITAFRKVLIKQEDEPLSDIEKELKPAARALDKLVMEKVRGLVGNTTRLFIAPDGNLNLIPFDALVGEHNKYLVEQYEISYLTSGRDLLRLQNGIGSEQPTMVMADPNYGDEQGPGTKMGNYVVSGSRLKETALEAEQIKEMLNLKPDEILLQDKATKTALKQMHRPDILHISTHGFFLKGEEVKPLEKDLSATRRIKIGSGLINEGKEQATDGEVQEFMLNNPLMQSGLLFAGVNEGRRDEGVLTALEATALDLWGTKMVVLSACDTGIGEVKNGDGVYGLRRALVLAGSESQLMSLWPVSDVGTREMMIKYYEALKNDEGRSAGMRRVRLELLKDSKRQHPYYWASFIQSGEWANLKGIR